MPSSSSAGLGSSVGNRSESRASASSNGTSMSRSSTTSIATRRAVTFASTFLSILSGGRSNSAANRHLLALSHVFQAVQVASFCAGLNWDNAGAFKLFMSLRAFTISSTPKSMSGLLAAWAILSFLCLFSSIYVVYRRVFHMHSREGRIFKINSNLIALIGGVLLSPILYASLGMIGCGTTIFTNECSKSSDSLSIVVSSIVLLVALLAGLVHSLYQNDISCNPAKSSDFFAILLFLPRLLLFFNIVALNVVLRFTATATSDVRTFVLAGISGGSAVISIGYIVLQQPYFKSISNHLVSGLWGIVLASSVSVVIGRWKPFYGFVIFWPLALVLFVAAALASLIYYRIWLSKLRFAVNSELREENATQVQLAIDSSPAFKSPIAMYLIVTRILWQETKRENLELAEAADRLRQLVRQLLDVDPGSIFRQMMYGVFMLETGDLPSFVLHYNRAMKLLPRFDEMMLLERLSEKRGFLAKQIDGGQEEMNASLAIAEKHHIKARKLVFKFWKEILQGSSLDAIPRIIEELDGVEKKAIGIYEKLLQAFPNSASLMRQYSSFLTEISCERLAGTELLLAAEQIEEEQSTAHRNKKDPPKGKKKSKNPFAKQSSQIHPAVSKEEINIEAPPEKSDLGATAHSNVRFGGPDIQKAVTSYPDEFPAQEHENEDLDQVDETDIELDAELTMRQQDDILLETSKQKIFQMKSVAFRQLMITAVVLVIVMLINGCVTYGLSKTGTGAFKYTFEVVGTAAKFRNIMDSVIVDISDSAVTGKVSDMADHLNTGIKLLTALYEDAAITIYYPFNAWHQLDYNLSIWDGVEIDVDNMTERYSHKYQICDVYTVATETVRFAGNVPEDYEREKLFNYESYRFLLDNFEIIIKATRNLLSLYHTAVHTTISGQMTVMIITVAASLGTVFLLCGILFLHSISLIYRERRASLSLFMSIPRGVMVNIVQKLQNQDESLAGNEDISMASIQVNAARVASMKEFGVSNVVLRFVIGVFAMTALVLALLGLTLSTFTSSMLPLLVTYMRTHESAELRHIPIYANALASKDFFSAPFLGGEQAIRDILVEKSDNIYNLKQEAIRSMGFFGVDLLTQELRDLRMSTNCSAFLENHTDILEGEGCFGIEDADNFVMHKAIEVAHTHNETKMKHLIHRLTVMERASSKWHLALLELLLTTFYADLIKAEVTITIIFAVLWPLSIGVFIVLYFPLMGLKLQYSRTLRMLLMIPPKTLNSITEIQAFLDNGEKTDMQKQLTAALEKTQSQTAQILTAAADAVIVFHATNLTIEAANPATTKLFGYDCGELIGKPISLLIPESSINVEDESAANSSQLDVMGKRKDGTEFPVFISRSVAGAIGAVFIRDVSEVALYQQQNEGLLHKILPKSIAARLIGAEGDSVAMIADGHASASILFADIVNFTKWASTMSPEILVKLLNDLISMWDTLATHFKVEKIKTIGDCYMCVAGCPEKDDDHAVHIVQFAESMLIALSKFNQKHGLKLQTRIGINSGPIVAGVIGLSKVQYDIWGSSVNLASRMESNGSPDAIQISHNTYQLLPPKKFDFIARGEIEVKGGLKTVAYVYTPGTNLDTGVSSGQDKAAANTQMETVMMSMTKELEEGGSSFAGGLYGSVRELASLRKNQSKAALGPPSGGSFANSLSSSSLF